jgi:isopentenyl-diphosphate delta-isomerase
LAREVAPHTPLIASGGIRDGLDVAKAIALGADAAGIAGPFLRSAADGTESARSLAKELIEVLRIAMFALGIRSIEELRSTKRLVRT